MVSKPIRVAMALLVAVSLLAGFLYFYFFRSLSAGEIIAKTLRQGKKIDSYHLLLEIEPGRGDEGREYFARVWFRNPHFFRIDFFSIHPDDDTVADQTIVSDGEGTWLFSPEIGDQFTLGSTAQELAPTPFLLHTFLNGLAGSRESTLLGVEKTGEGFYYLLRIVPQVAQGDHAYEEIWLEKRTLLPARIDIYDQHSKLKQRVIYHKIVPNAEISQTLFQK
ncbi:MAG TPA: outer membrane lipoprotein carrier protein LolA [Firmicutes bacterium]|jgi:outer membrane lipoprotein-sorting protein|nr:outer membrane lipoprotein carrier protein LolA [Bacillota bacterium]